VEALDLNRDALLDLAFGSGPDLRVVLGTAAGEFIDGGALQQEGYSISALRSSDLDGDGIAELIAVYGTASELSLVRFGGAGLELAKTLAVGVSPIDTIPVDLDGSGGKDLIVVDAANAVHRLLNLTVPVEELDCDRSGRLDSCEIAGGTLADEDGDGRPDDCATRSVPYVRADVNVDAQVDIADPVSLLSFLFLDGAPLACRASADTDGGGTLDLTDAIRILEYLFLGGRPPVGPFPACGRPTFAERLSCEEFAHCAN
jgi:hypothetical protein